MLRLIFLSFLVLSTSFIACSKDKPAPVAPAGKIVASQDAPEKPTNLRISQLTNSSVRVEWDAVEMATDYDINYRTAVGGRWTNWPHRGASRTYSIIHGLEPNTEYRWAVRAENKDGSSRWVFAENFTTLAQQSPAITEGNPDQDRQTLIKVYEILADAAGQDIDWLKDGRWTSRSTIAKWYGVTVENGRVVELFFEYKGSRRTHPPQTCIPRTNPISIISHRASPGRHTKL